jgi:mono/diheme cytochrome c family protein
MAERLRKNGKVKQMADYLIPAGVLAAFLVGSAVLAQSMSGDSVEGEKFAREICVTCHDVGKGQHGISLDGAPAFQDVADEPAVTSLALRVFLRSPHEVMPDLMDDVITYILSLK